jgi:competence protein ComEC
LTKVLFKKQPKVLGSAAIETFCAELMALPFIMLMFGQLSLIGLVANVLVVPLVPIAMLFSAVAAAAGMWLTPVAGWFALPANLLLTYMLDLIRLLASVPGIFQNRTISLTGLLVFYCSILLIVAVAHRFRTPKNAIITDEKLA